MEKEDDAKQSDSEGSWKARDKTKTKSIEKDLDHGVGVGCFFA